jgi:hypothetical protein
LHSPLRARTANKFYIEATKQGTGESLMALVGTGASQDGVLQVGPAAAMVAARGSIRWHQLARLQDFTHRALRLCSPPHFQALGSVDERQDGGLQRGARQGPRSGLGAAPCMHLGHRSSTISPADGAAANAAVAAHPPLQASLSSPRPASSWPATSPPT